MTTAYSPLLGLALPVTGELSGTWGDTVNNSITSLLDSAVAGTTTLSTDADVTLTTTTGAANTSREAILLFSGARTVLRTVTAPAASKIYTVINATTGGFGVKVVGAGPTTGVTIAAGESAVIAWNGSDFIKISNTGGAVSFTNVTVTGTTTLSGLTASTALALDASKNVVSVTNTGTGNNVLAASPTITGTASIATLNLTNALTTAYGGTGLTSFTAGDLPYYAAGTVLSKLAIGTSGQILTSSGTAPQWSTLSGVAVTTFSAGTTGFTPSSATSGAITLSGTLATTNGGTGLTSFTANGVVYASSTSALATGSALTFDGTNLGLGGTVTSSVNGYGFKISNSSGNNGYFQATNGTQNFIFGVSSGNLPLIGTLSSDPVAFYASGSEQMRLTSTGLGIGTSSPNAKVDVVGAGSNVGFKLRSGGNSGVNILDIGDTAGSGLLVLNALGNLGIGTSSPSYKLDVQKTTTGTVASFRGSSAGRSLYVTSSTTTNDGDTYTLDSTSGTGVLAFATQSIERMRLDPAGNLGLGVPPSAWGGGYKAIEILGYLGLGVAGGTTQLFTNSFYNGSNYIYRNTAAASYYAQSAGSHFWSTAPSGTAGNAITFTQAMTLDASGRLLVNTTSNFFTNSKIQVTGSAGPTLGVQQTTSTEYAGGFWNNAASSTNLIGFYSGSSGAFVGSITYNGSLVLYNTTSDQRLKENIQDADSASSLVDALQVRKFDWKESSNHQRYGFIAQELVTVVPEAVHQPADPEQMMAVDYSKLVPMLVKEIQDLRKRLAAAGI